MRRYIYKNSLGREIEFSVDTGFRLTNIEGLSALDIAITEVSGSSQIGASAASSKIETKDITIEGDFAESYQHRRNLIDTVMPCIAAKLRFIDTDKGLDLFLDGEPKRTPDISNDVGYQQFQFVFHVYYPVWQSTEDKVTSFIGYDARFCFPMRFSNVKPWKISQQRLAVIKNVINDGSLVTGFAARFRAITAVISPELLNIKTQEVIRFKKGFILNPDDLLYVSTYDNQKKVILTKASTGKSENGFKYLADETVFWQLQPGDNPIKYGAANNHEGLEVMIMFKTAFVGV